MKNIKIKLKNPKVFIFSLIALGFLVLTFLVHWAFITGAVACMIINQRELMRKK